MVKINAAAEDSVSSNRDDLHARIIRDYFNTTSSANLPFSINYQAESTGLKRGLKKWLNVKCKKVLDLGCGTGELCWLATSLGAQSVVGVNLSQDEINYIKSHIPATFICEDILDYLSKCKSESLDVIYALNILEHFNKDDLFKVLDESRRVLRDGGHLIAMVPNATSPYGTMTRYWDITHQQAFTQSSVNQLVRLCGFSKVEFAEWGPRVHGVISFCRYLLWQFIRATIYLRLMIETGSGKGGIYTADMLFRLSK